MSAVDPTWADRAACRGMDPAIFVPDRCALRVPSDVMAVCGRCPVRGACLAHATANNEPGYWGGTTEQARGFKPRRIPVQLKAIDHGTDAGYVMHLRRGVPACEACVEARRITQAARKAARKLRVVAA